MRLIRICNKPLVAAQALFSKTLIRFFIFLIYISYYKNNDAFGLTCRQVVEGVTGCSIDANFEMQQCLVSIIPAHLRNLLTGLDLLAFRYQSLAIVCIGTEQAVAVLDDDEFAVSNQSITAIDHLSGCTSADGLTFFPPDFNPVTGRIIGLEIADDPALGWPKPPGRITPRSGRSRRANICSGSGWLVVACGRGLRSFQSACFRRVLTTAVLSSAGRWLRLAARTG